MSGNGEEPVWRLNYFNYFTEVEEHFQRARGSGLFLLSPLDWALIEGWKNSGVPLEAALRGIDAAFEKWHAKKKKLQAVNSLAYCAQAVLEAAQQMANAAIDSSPPPEEANPFTAEAVGAHLGKARAALAEREGYGEVTAALDRLAAELDEHLKRPQELDQRLTALEEKMAAVARTRLSDEELFEARREMEAQLRPYRGKMSVEQLSMLERKYLDRRVFESARLPRLSLFYLEMK